MQGSRYLTRRFSIGFEEDLESRLSDELARLDGEGYRVVSVLAAPPRGAFRGMRWGLVLIAAVFAVSLLTSVVPRVLGWVSAGRTSPFDIVGGLLLLALLLMLPLSQMGGKGGQRFRMIQMSFLIVAERKEP